MVTAGEAPAALAGCDVVVRSPGVSIHRPELQELRAAGTPVTTATSLWMAEREGRRVIGVTGTKGKSTTAALACHLARAAGRDVELAGNIGRPALDLLDADPEVLAVVELSSYHLADLETGPEVAVITNLFAEHADWHGSEGAYRADKLRILSLPGVATVVAARLASPSSRRSRPPPGACCSDSAMDGTRPPPGSPSAGVLRVPAQELPLPGAHNALNVCAALAALGAAGVVLEDPAAALRGFEGLPHRLQTVLERRRPSRGSTTASRPPRSRRSRRSRAFRAARSCCSAAARIAGRTTPSWAASWRFARRS